MKNYFKESKLTQHVEETFETFIEFLLGSYRPRMCASTQTFWDKIDKTKNRRTKKVDKNYSASLKKLWKMNFLLGKKVQSFEFSDSLNFSNRYMNWINFVPIISCTDRLVWNWVEEEQRAISMRWCRKSLKLKSFPCQQDHKKSFRKKSDVFPVQHYKFTTRFSCFTSGKKWDFATKQDGNGPMRLILMHFRTRKDVSNWILKSLTRWAWQSWMCRDIVDVE